MGKNGSNIVTCMVSQLYFKRICWKVINQTRSQSVACIVVRGWGAEGLCPRLPASVGRKRFSREF